MQIPPSLTEELLARLPVRKRAILKLRTGCAPLSAEEFAPIPENKRHEATTVAARSLREIADLLGISKERVRQLENRALEMLGVAYDRNE